MLWQGNKLLEFDQNSNKDSHKGTNIYIVTESACIIGCLQFFSSGSQALLSRQAFSHSELFFNKSLFVVHFELVIYVLCFLQYPGPSQWELYSVGVDSNDFSEYIFI